MPYDLSKGDKKKREKEEAEKQKCFPGKKNVYALNSESETENRKEPDNVNLERIQHKTNLAGD